MAIVFFRFYRAKGDDIDSYDAYGGKKVVQSSPRALSSRYPMNEEFDIQALYRSVIIDPADSDEASRRGSGHSVEAMAASSGRRPSSSFSAPPPLRSTSRTRATTGSGSYSGLSPADSPDHDDIQSWNEDGLGVDRSLTSASGSFYEDEDRVYYHGNEQYTVTERVLRTSGKSSDQSVSTATLQQARSQNSNRKARRSTRRDLLFEPTDILELETRSANNSDAEEEETKPLVDTPGILTHTVLSTTEATNENHAVAELTRTSSSSPRSESSSSSCDSVPEPTTTASALVATTSARSVTSYEDVADDELEVATVYVSRSMK